MPQGSVLRALLGNPLCSVGPGSSGLAASALPAEAPHPLDLLLFIFLSCRVVCSLVLCVCVYVCVYVSVCMLMCINVCQLKCLCLPVCF